jgi:hypothetical protein
MRESRHKAHGEKSGPHTNDPSGSRPVQQFANAAANKHAANKD